MSDKENKGHSEEDDDEENDTQELSYYMCSYNIGPAGEVYANFSDDNPSIFHTYAMSLCSQIIVTKKGYIQLDWPWIAGWAYTGIFAVTVRF